MGYLKEMYGKRPEDFVKGVLVGIFFFSDFVQGLEYFGGSETVKDALREAVNDLAESPETFDVESVIKRGYV